jgi:hypothetical protein
MSEVEKVVVVVRLSEGYKQSLIRSPREATIVLSLDKGRFWCTRDVHPVVTLFPKEGDPIALGEMSRLTPARKDLPQALGEIVDQQLATDLYEEVTFRGEVEYTGSPKAVGGGRLNYS